MISYKEYFSNLNTAKVKGQKAPHKAVMLLSIIDLVESSDEHENAFLLDDSLESIFKKLWERYVGDSSVFQPAPATPFYHLISEPFWSIKYADGRQVDKLKSTPSIGYLRKNEITAVLSDDLYEDMLDPHKRDDMRSILVSKYLSNNAGSSGDTDDIGVLKSVIEKLTSRLEKANANNDSLERALRDQEAITANLALQLKKEILERDERIAMLNNEISELKDTAESLRATLDKVPKEAIPEAEILPSGLDEYRFLKRIDEKDMPVLPSDYRSIKYVFSKQDRTHYEIQHALIHQDENMLSTLRVRLYEQYQANPDNPLLVCSCCKRPVLLSGNSGVKGAIIGFRHHGEGNVYTGEHEGEFFGIPKQETESELQPLKDCFMLLRSMFVNYEANDSFILLPGKDRKKSFADITFSLDGKRIAVIFASVAHPLDFIIRRARAAHDMGYLPLWILSSSFFYSSALSNRDISTFSKGFLCTIDEETVGESEYYDTPCIKVRDFYNKSVSIVRLSSFITNIQEAIEELIQSPEWAFSLVKVKRPRLSEARVKSLTKTIVKKDNRVDSMLPKVAKTVSAVDYWKGKRQHLKDDLFLERLDSGVGIVDLKAHRYPVLPIYNKARISEDKKEVEFYLKDELSLTFKVK